MRHPDDGLILAFLEEELATGEEAEIRAHLAACAACGAEVDGLKRALERSARALTLLDAEPPTREARARLEARRAGNRKPRGGRGWWLPLSRAAGIVLLLAGGASAAVPGSPVREWIARGWGAVRAPGTPAVLEGTPGAPEGAVAAPEVQPFPFETGATLLPEAGGVELWIHEVPPGTEVTVLLSEEGQAGIFAGTGTRYRTEAGKLEAWAPPGAVRVELPRDLPRAVVGVNGVVVLRQAGAQREIMGVVVRQGAGEIVLRAPSGTGGSSNAPRPQG